METLPVPVASCDELQDNDAIGHLPQALADAVRAARTFAAAEQAPATRAAYAADWTDFSSWCDSVDLDALPASAATVAAYIAALADRRLAASTIKRRLAAIAHVHRHAGLEPPTTARMVAAVHAGIRRSIGVAVAQKAPATANIIAAMLRRLPADTLLAKRDRALLLTGFAGALRRSELVALDVADLAFQAEGVLVRIGRSKTDQEGAGHSVPIPNGRKLRPVEALRDWLAVAGIAEGAVFRRIRRGGHLTGERLGDRAVALIVKRWAAAAGLDTDDFAGHSLRAGFVTSALADGADVFAAADQGRWAKLETVRVYDRRAKAFRNHAGKGFL